MEEKKQHTFFVPRVSSAMVLNYHKNSFRLILLSVVTSTKRTTSTTVRKLQASPKFIIKTKRSCRKPRVRTFDQLWFINIIILSELWLGAQIYFVCMYLYLYIPIMYTVKYLDHGFYIWLQKYIGFIVLTHSFQSLDTENNDIHTHMFRL